MSAQIDSKPTLIVPANQKLIFTISDTGTAPDRYIVQVEEDGNEIAKLYLTPNTNDVVHFDLSEIVKDRVYTDDVIRDQSESLHPYTGNYYTTARHGMKKYEVKVGSFDGGTETLNEDSDSVYLVGGAEQLSAGLHPSFSDYYCEGVLYRKTWMTNRDNPSNLIQVNATDNCEGVTAFLNDTNIINFGGFFVFYTLYSASGVLVTWIWLINATNGAQAPSASDNNQKLTYMPFLPKNLDTVLPIGYRPSQYAAWTHYTLDIWNATQRISTTLRVNRVCGSSKHQNTQLAWTNSVGGWDYLLFKGRTEHTDQVSSKPYKKQVGNYDAATYTFLPESRESQDYQKTAQTKYKLFNQDFSFAELELLKYCFRSDNVYIRQGESGLWQPVIVDTKSYNVKEAFSGMFSVSVDVTLAQDVKC